MKKISFLLLLFVFGEVSFAHCTWRHPRHCTIQVPKLPPLPPLPIPQKITCAQYIGNPDYIRTVIIMRDNLDELHRVGIADLDACKNGRDLVTATLGKYDSIFAVIAWDVGRCACEEVF
jgi:hypothetical protein